LISYKNKVNFIILFITSILEDILKYNNVPFSVNDFKSVWLKALFLNSGWKEKGVGHDVLLKLPSNLSTSRHCEI
jgi:hypothetical protein